MKIRSSIYLIASVAILTTLLFSCKKEQDDRASVRDIDGNTYHTVTIGTQVWMAENLKVTHYRDGSAINLAQENNDWNNAYSGAYCWYNNDESMKNTYGALYNWKAVNDSRNICPEGWHIPGNQEWLELIRHLGGQDSASIKLKETGLAHWNAPNAKATNETGFTAVPGGFRKQEGFSDLGNYSAYWSTDETCSIYACYYYFNYNDDYYTQYFNISKNTGLSVRCIKD